MKRVTALMLLSLASSFAQDSPDSPASLRWRDISLEYKNFSEIRAVLVNDGTQSVFLSRIYPHGYAQLDRLNENTGEWEEGAWGISCGTVADATIPIEVPPQTERDIKVYWQLSTDDWDKPKHFVTLSSHENRPLAGRYKFTLRYSLEPWTIAHEPRVIHKITSSEFLVTKQLRHKSK